MDGKRVASATDGHGDARVLRADGIDGVRSVDGASGDDDGRFSAMASRDGAAVACVFMLEKHMHEFCEDEESEIEKRKRGPHAHGGPILCCRTPSR